MPKIVFGPVVSVVCGPPVHALVAFVKDVRVAVTDRSAVPGGFLLSERPFRVSDLVERGGDRSLGSVFSQSSSPLFHRGRPMAQWVLWMSRAFNRPRQVCRSALVAAVDTGMRIVSCGGRSSMRVALVR